MSISSLASHIAASLADGDGDGVRLRLVRQFLMDLDRFPDPGCLIDIEPEPTGDRRWDALLAGVAEDIALRRHLPVPAWTVAPIRFLDQWWFVGEFSALHPLALVETPAAIANRGVFIRRASLLNL